MISFRKHGRRTVHDPRNREQGVVRLGGAASLLLVLLVVVRLRLRLGRSGRPQIRP
ncbi:MAG: hypothetical protein M0C28_16495 [Candidatus Moduliflexus flocculans]|nr:hypothetical protein [Candidatus Moduliflexus flocculans]